MCKGRAGSPLISKDQACLLLLRLPLTDREFTHSDRPPHPAPC